MFESIFGKECRDLRLLILGEDDSGGRWSLKNIVDKVQFISPFLVQFLEVVHVRGWDWNQLVAVGEGISQLLDWRVI